MRILLAAVALMAVAGCADPGPAGPTLPMKFRFEIEDYEDSGPILPITGRLELVIEPNGTAFAATRRKIFTDFERSGPLTREQLEELVSRVEAWTSKGGDLPSSPKPYGLILYGEKKARWDKEKALSPELQELVKFLLTIPPTLHPVWRGTKRSG